MGQLFKHTNIEETRKKFLELGLGINLPVIHFEDDKEGSYSEVPLGVFSSHDKANELYNSLKPYYEGLVIQGFFVLD